jgi:hypothetical protein
VKIQEIRELAKQKGVLAGKMNKTELIRAYQRAEGHRDCFGTPFVHDCGQINCLWRKDCVKNDI